MKKVFSLICVLVIISNTSCYELLPIPESDELNLKVPTNEFPKNGATNITLNYSDDLTLKWEYKGYAEYDVHYLIYVSTNPDLTDSYTNSVKFQKFFEVSLEHKTTYYWKIVANYNDYFAESEVWHFTTN